MAPVKLPDILRLIKLDKLTKPERDYWKKRFSERKEELETALKAVNKGLQALKKKQ